MSSINTAIISVSDKSGIVEFAQGLCDLDVRIYSTGGTLSALKDGGVEATPVEQLTQFPEMMDGRVKTLHPAVFAGLLARRDNDKDIEQLQQHNLRLIDLVVVNLYPFQQVLARQGATQAEIIENIDIGGPSMLRAAAKNFKFVTAVTSPESYPRILAEMKSNDGQLSDATRRALAQEVFAHTADYDACIRDYFSEKSE